ncbi:MAG: AAA family ATPase [Dysgonomonas sp.]
MKVSFENLGVVKKIDLDLSKKLLVFCGPNGTGKTYVSYAIYGYLEKLLGDNLFDITRLIQEKQLEVTIDYDNLYLLKQRYKRLDIGSLFGVNSTIFSGFKIKVNSSKKSFKEAVRASSFSFNYTAFNCPIVYQKKEKSDQIILNLINDADITDFVGDSGILHNAILGKYLCFQSIISAYILPVERSSVYTFANELARNKFTHTATIDSRYPRPIQDALATAVDLNFIKVRESKYKWLAEDIEQQILHGRIEISTDGEMQFKPEKSDKTLSVHLSASFIKNLSGLLIYLKHQAKENELLIIDEPELGLHPDNQIRLARIFARLINNGIRLLINTHSDYIIRELNNLIMLSSDSPEIKKNLKKWGYQKDEKIKPEDIGAYLFDFDKKDTNQVVVRSLDVDQKGFEVETIDKAINLLNENSENIYYSLKYGKED